MAIDKELFYASHGLKYPIIARPYTNDMTVKEKFYTKADMVAVLDKIRAEIEQAADKQFQIAMGVADLNERYTHIQMENAYRHILNIFDKYKAEIESQESEE